MERSRQNQGSFWSRRDRRRRKVKREIEGEGDPLDSTLFLATASTVGVGISIIAFGYYWLTGADWWVLLCWGMVLGLLLLNIGVTLFWGTEKSGLHVKAGPYKFAPVNLEFFDWVECSVRDIEGYRLTWIQENIRTHGVINWWKAHGGRTKPYISANVAGSERRFNPKGLELGPDWKTPIDTFNRVKRERLDAIERIQKVRMIMDIDGEILPKDEHMKIIDPKTQKPSPIKKEWDIELFPIYVSLMRNNGRIPQSSELPGKAGIWHGSDYLLFGDFSATPREKMKSEIVKGLERDRPYFQDYSYALISTVAYPWIGPVHDYRPPDFQKELDDARLRSYHLSAALEAAGETTWSYADQFRDTSGVDEVERFPERRGYYDRDRD
ncbi:MAG: hypothetical protein JSW41_00435 [Candidatus Aenigmatarchaeota archaeon]|nr:MAG: hypothetical protein JSW41_00435 [Candidatus Aenigmarchaeota archaeon]